MYSSGDNSTLRPPIMSWRSNRRYKLTKNAPKPAIMRLLSWISLTKIIINKLAIRWSNPRIHNPHPQVVMSNGEYLASNIMHIVAKAVEPNAYNTVMALYWAPRMAAISPYERVRIVNRMKFIGKLLRLESTQTNTR